MKFYQYLIISILCIACTNQSNSNQEKSSTVSQNFNKEWANNKLWYDGLAEVAIYDAQRIVYKKQRNFEYTYITVSEDFNKEFRVKTDDYKRKDLYKVMKLNAFASIKTENYPYHYLSSMFFYFDKPWEMDKMTTSSQEWCGNTFKEYLNEKNNYLMSYNSYFDEEGDGEQKIATETLFEDQLSYSLRSLKFKEGLNFDAKILESQISNKVGKLKIYNAKLLVAEGNNAIPEKATWKVTVNLEPNKANVYYFEKAYPNLLIKQNTWDGINLTLKKTSRYAYWQH